MSLEADLSAPISEWPIRLGYVPYAEVPFPNCARCIDLVGRNGSDLFMVELKRTLTAHANHQAAICDLITSKRYAVNRISSNSANISNLNWYVE